MPIVVRFSGLQSYEDWKRVRDSRKTGSKSLFRRDPLTQVNTSVKRFVAHRSFQSRLSVDDAISRVRKIDPATYTKYEAPLVWLIQQLRQLQPGRAANSVFPFYEKSMGVSVARSLNEMRDFAVTDLKSFPNSPAPRQKGRVFNRYHLMTPGERERGDGMASGYVKGRLSRHTIAMASPLVEVGKCGCCTTFAARATDILLKSDCPRRVELVAIPKTGTRVAHCFVLVGRKPGLAPNGKLPLPSSDAWGIDYCVVDPWLGALGFESFFPKGAGFSDKWLSGVFASNGVGTGLELKFASDRVDPIQTNLRQAVQLRKVDMPVEKNPDAGRVI